MPLFFLGTQQRCPVFQCSHHYISIRFYFLIYQSAILHTHTFVINGKRIFQLAIESSTRVELGQASNHLLQLDLSSLVIFIFSRSTSLAVLRRHFSSPGMSLKLLREAGRIFLTKQQIRRKMRGCTQYCNRNYLKLIFRKYDSHFCECVIIR